MQGSWKGRPLLDCCGTGGGGLNLINISTGLMFILAALGIPVVKHGNRGITKKSGSADVLEALGISIDLPPQLIHRCLDEVGCAFLFAPAYHPTFAAVAPVRRALAAQGQRTVFNLLGPLLNPVRPDARLVGVFKPEHIALYQNALEQMKCPRFTVACGEDALSRRMIGEVSAQGTTILGGTLRLRNGTLLEKLAWSSFGAAPTLQNLDSILVHDAQESARHLVAIFSGDETGLGRETLLINAAVAAWTHGTATSLAEGMALSREAIDSGKALERLATWQEFSKQV
jgi:anthranilate phosphoribosyltransferase